MEPEIEDPSENLSNLEKLMTQGYWAGERKRKITYIDGHDEDIAKLKVQIAQLRGSKRQLARELQQIEDQMRHDAYTDCLTCFPYRDFEAARALLGKHTCGLTAAERVEVSRSFR